MTLREIMEDRRASLVEFFTWRFGTKNWRKPLRSIAGLDPHGMSARNMTLLRWEEVAMKLGYRPGVPIDIVHPPPRPPARQDSARDNSVRSPVGQYYFERALASPLELTVERSPVKP